MVSVAKRTPSIAGDLNKLSSVETLNNNGNVKNSDFYQLAVKDLKLNQLKLLHVILIYQ